MSLIALFSDKGSPGATTLGLAMAAVSRRRVALVECDPAGGDLALRLTDPAGHPIIAPEPGLLTLAAATRHTAAASESAGLVWEHGQPISTAPPGSVVVPGLTFAEQGSGLAGLWPAIATALAGTSGGDVIADLGRLHLDSPACAIAAAADTWVGVGRGDAQGILRLRDRLGNLMAKMPTGHDLPRRLLAVLVVEDRHAHEAVGALRAALAHAGYPVTVAGFLAVDPAAVRALHAGQRGGRLERSLLLRSARGLLPHLDAEPASPPSGAPEDDPSPSEPPRRLPSLARSR